MIKRNLISYQELLEENSMHHDLVHSLCVIRERMKGAKPDQAIAIIQDVWFHLEYELTKGLPTHQVTFKPPTPKTRICQPKTKE